MSPISILNDVLGPVMRGPSSSHTAGAYRIGKLARSLLDDEPERVACTFDPGGSLAPTCEQLGVDLGFVSGMMDWSMLSDDYTAALEKAKRAGVAFEFSVNRLDHSQHPNAVLIDAIGKKGKSLLAGAESIGGGSVRFTLVDHWPLVLTGESFYVLVETESRAADQVKTLLSDETRDDPPEHFDSSDSHLLFARFQTRPRTELCDRIRGVEGVRRIRCLEPLFPVKSGIGVFASGEQMVTVAQERGLSLGKVALLHESTLLECPENDVLEELAKRLEIMTASVEYGLDDRHSDMLLLGPTAGQVLGSDARGQVAVGGIHTRAAARAMAVMHTSNSRGVVCAAPTGGSAGVIPGVLTSLIQERGLECESAAFALLAAGAVGSIIAERATFAAETAGCQVEIGAAGAMAAAAVIEVAGGNALQASDAAAISLQNTMGSVCDPVHGTCEVPCHTRNAVAASSAFVCADLVLGGYRNPIPLDETIDASFSVGKVLPRELRCTAAGGLAVAPSALALERLR